MAALLLLCSAGAFAYTPLMIDPDVDTIDLQPYIQLIVDERGELNVEQVLARTDLGLNTSAQNNLGFMPEAVWIRFQLTSAANGPEQILLTIGYPMLDQVTLYLSLPDGSEQRFEAGDLLPFSSRALSYREPTFEIPLEPNKATIGVLRLQTQGSLQFPLTLWDANAYGQHVADHQFYYGLYYGIFLVLALLACITYWFTRDSTFFLYALYLTSFAFLQLSLNGFISQYLWPYGTLLPSRMPPLLTGITMILLILFTIKFLGFWRSAPLLRWAFRLFLFLSAATTLMAAVGPLRLAVVMGSALGFSLLPLILASGIMSWRRGVRAARYFVIAWGLLLVSVSITALTLAGLLPSSFYTTYAMQIGSVLEIWMLAVALLDRIRILREEKESAVESANRYLTQLNAELENLVTERTRELETTNARLQDIADRDSLTGLLNHRSSNERLATLVGNSNTRTGLMAVIMLDIDHFKMINDRFGHQTGDRVLLAVAEVLRCNTSPEGVCGRYGGEEFLIADTVADRAAAAALGDRLLGRISSLSFDRDGALSITASLGIALATPKPGIFAEELIQRADKALYIAKREGRNRLIFDPDPYRKANIVPLRSS